MNMHSIAWWPVLTLLAIPNWLVLIFWAAGVIANTASCGMKGLGQNMGAIALAAAVTGVLCWLRGMGRGDLKLCAAVGGWIGPGQRASRAACWR
jgi:prepilin peptidase CpaA